MKLSHLTSTYLCSLATLQQSFQPSSEEFDAKHWSKKPQTDKSKWQRAVNPSGLHWESDSARGSEPWEGLEINVFGGGNRRKKSVFCRGTDCCAGLHGGNPAQASCKSNCCDPPQLSYHSWSNWGVSSAKHLSSGSILCHQWVLCWTGT